MLFFLIVASIQLHLIHARESRGEGEHQGQHERRGLQNPFLVPTVNSHFEIGTHKYRCHGRCGRFNGLWATCHCDAVCDINHDCCEDYARACVSCSDAQFKCRNGAQCIDDRWKCDGTFECNDGSDESGCPCGGDSDCPMRGQSCHEGQCVFAICAAGDSSCLCGNQNGDIVYCSRYAGCVVDNENRGECVMICTVGDTNCLCGKPPMTSPTKACRCEEPQTCQLGKENERECKTDLGVGPLCDGAIIMINLSRAWEYLETQTPQILSLIRRVEEATETEEATVIPYDFAIMLRCFDHLNKCTVFDTRVNFGESVSTHFKVEHDDILHVLFTMC